MNHIDEITCMLYLDGQLDRERARELTAHMEQCAECQGLLGVLAGEGRWLKEALVEADEAVPARLFEPRTRTNSAPWGWIAAFGFGSAGAYTLWNNFLEPVQRQFDQAGFSSQNLFTVLLFNGALWKGWESMRSLVEFLAMGMFGILMLVLFRRNWRRGTTLAVVMASLLCALALPQGAEAAEVHKTAGEYVLGAGEEVKNDLIVYGGLIRIEGKVDGDVIAFGQSVRIDGHVTGDVIAFARDVRVSGQVDGNVRSFVQSLTVEGQVGKNISSFSDLTEVDSKGKIGRNIYLFSSVAALEGEVGRDATVYAGTTRLTGTVNGDLYDSSDRLSIGSNASIGGMASYKGHHQPDVAAGAKLAHPLEIKIISKRPDYVSARYYWHQALLWGSAFLVGLAFILFAPGIVTEAVRSGDHFPAAFGFGALLLIATPVVAVILCVTLVGIGLGVACFLLYLIGLYSGQCFVGAWLGEKILGAGIGTSAVIGRLALGLLVIRILRLIPYAGGLILLLVTIWGFGALIVALYRTARPQMAMA
jgi:cytoskeletal protein CcmA (bactofilin family)